MIPQPLGIDFPVADLFSRAVLGFRMRPSWLPVVIASGLGSVGGVLHGRVHPGMSVSRALAGVVGGDDPAAGTAKEVEAVEVTP